jgi:DNA-directed RNA polymerase subunit RPC12/RpoP/broad-specificity NMP kinase
MRSRIRRSEPFSSRSPAPRTARRRRRTSPAQPRNLPPSRTSDSASRHVLATRYVQAVLYVCERCGAWSDEVNVEGDEHICPACGHRRRFRRLPFFAVTGASGAGKTAVGSALPAALPECVVLEHDLLWRSEYAQSPPALEQFRRTWLRIAMNIAQGGRPLVLLGTVLPEHYEDQPERRWFTDIYYLALVCSDQELERRLRARPAWRGYDDEKVRQMRAFNNWLRKNADGTSPPMTVLDATSDPVEATVTAVVAWVRQGLTPLRD